MWNDSEVDDMVRERKDTRRKRECMQIEVKVQRLITFGLEVGTRLWHRRGSTTRKPENHQKKEKSQM